MKEFIIVIVTVFYTFITLPLRILNKRKSRKEREASNYRLLRNLIRVILFIAGIEILVDGKENIDIDRNYLIIGNHKSDLDSLILISLLKKPIIFIGKKEIKNTPFISTWFKEIGCLYMERDNIRQSAQVIFEGSEILKSGKSVVIFPEGKRIIGDSLGEFKNGSFKLAIKSNKNVLPVAIIDSQKALEEPKRLKGIEIKVRIGKEIDWKELEYKKTKDICEHTKLVIEKLCLKPKEEI